MDRSNLVISGAFALADPNLFAPFFRFTGGWLLKVYKLTFGITSDEGLEHISVLFHTDSVNMVIPILEAFLKQLTIAGSMTSTASSVTALGLSLWMG